MYWDAQTIRLSSTGDNTYKFTPRGDQLNNPPGIQGKREQAVNFNEFAAEKTRVNR
jgi:hypothetical protein